MGYMLALIFIGVLGLGFGFMLAVVMQDEE